MTCAKRKMNVANVEMLPVPVPNPNLQTTYASCAYARPRKRACAANRLAAIAAFGPHPGLRLRLARSGPSAAPYGFRRFARHENRLRGTRNFTNGSRPCPTLSCQIAVRTFCGDRPFRAFRGTRNHTKGGKASVARIGTEARCENIRNAVVMTPIARQLPLDMRRN